MSIFDIFKKKQLESIKNQEEPIINNNSNQTHGLINGIESISLMDNYPQLPFTFINIPYIIQENNNNEKIYLFSGENLYKAKSIILFSKYSYVYKALTQLYLGNM